jgi:hypothetical protein
MQQAARVRELIDEDDIGLGERSRRAQRHELGIARSCANEINLARHRSVHVA